MALQDGLLSFNIKETVFLSPDKAGIGELKELELVPDVEVLENDTYISITGCLHLIGKYQPIRETAEAKGSGTETLIEAMTFPPFQRQGADQMLFEWDERISHRIPLNITIPLERIRDASDIFAIVDSFDYQLESPHQMVIEAELRLGGIQFAEIRETQESSQAFRATEQPQEGELPHFAGDWTFTHVAGEEEGQSASTSAQAELEQREDLEQEQHGLEEALDQQHAHEEQAWEEQQAREEQQAWDEQQEWDEQQFADEQEQQTDWQGGFEEVRESGFAQQVESNQELEGWPASGREAESEDLFNTPALPARAHVEQRFGELTEDWEQETVSARSSLFVREAISAESPTSRPEEPLTAEEAERVVAIHDAEPRAVGFNAGQNAVESSAGSNAQQEAEPYPHQAEAVNDEARESIPASAREAVDDAVDDAVAEAGEVQADKSEAVETFGEQGEVKVSISGKSSGAGEGRLNITSIFTQASKTKQEAEEQLEQSSSSSSARKGAQETFSPSTLEAVQNLTSFVRNREERTSRLKLCIIQRNETLEQISQRYSLPVSKLMEANHLTSADQLVAGQILYIPQ